MMTDEVNTLNEVILQIFEEENSTFRYPIATQNGARAFVKALHLKGITSDVLCEEIHEFSHNFASWKTGLGRPGIGSRIMERINQPITEVLLSVSEDGGTQDTFQRKSTFRGSKRLGRGRKTVKILEEPNPKNEVPPESNTWEEETKISSDLKNKNSINMQKQTENETTAVLKSPENKSELTATEKAEASIDKFEIENNSRAYKDETVSASVKPCAEETLRSVKTCKENKTVSLKRGDGELLASVESQIKPQATTDLVRTYEKEAAALVESCLKNATEIVKSSNEETEIQVTPSKETPVELCKKQPTLEEGSPCTGEFPVKVPQNRTIPARPDKNEAVTLTKQYTTDMEPCGKKTSTLEKSCNQEKDAPVTLSINQEAKVKLCNDVTSTPTKPCAKQVTVPIGNEASTLVKPSRIEAKVLDKPCSDAAPILVKPSEIEAISRGNSSSDLASYRVKPCVKEMTAEVQVNNDMVPTLVKLHEIEATAPVKPSRKKYLMEQHDCENGVPVHPCEKQASSVVYNEVRTGMQCERETKSLIEENQENVTITNTTLKPVEKPQITPKIKIVDHNGNEDNELNSVFKRFFKKRGTVHTNDDQRKERSPENENQQNKQIPSSIVRHSETRMSSRSQTTRENHTVGELTSSFSDMNKHSRSQPENQNNSKQKSENEDQNKNPNSVTDRPKQYPKPVRANQIQNSKPVTENSDRNLNLELANQNMIPMDTTDCKSDSNSNSETDAQNIRNTAIDHQNGNPESGFLERKSLKNMVKKFNNMISDGKNEKQDLKPRNEDRKPVTQKPADARISTSPKDDRTSLMVKNIQQSGNLKRREFKQCSQNQLLSETENQNENTMPSEKSSIPSVSQRILHFNSMRLKKNTKFQDISEEEGVQNFNRNKFRRSTVTNLSFRSKAQISFSNANSSSGTPQSDRKLHVVQRSMSLSEQGKDMNDNMLKIDKDDRNKESKLNKDKTRF